MDKGTSLPPRRGGICYDTEGWGPLSTIRYDFTPCFLEIPQLGVAVFGVSAGCYTLWYLLRKCSKQQTSKDWHYFTKLVGSLFCQWRCHKLSDPAHVVGGCVHHVEHCCRSIYTAICCSRHEVLRLFILDQVHSARFSGFRVCHTSNRARTRANG